MANKEAEADGETPEGEGAEAPKTGLMGKLKSKKMLMILVPVVLLVVGGGGAVADFMQFKKSDKEKEAHADAVPLTPP